MVVELSEEHLFTPHLEKEDLLTVGNYSLKRKIEQISDTCISVRLTS